LPGSSPLSQILEIDTGCCPPPLLSQINFMNFNKKLATFHKNSRIIQKNEIAFDSECKRFSLKMPARLVSFFIH
jgi:hypothetical protein